MKHFMLPRNAILRENHHSESTSSSSTRSTTTTPRKPKNSTSSKENADPNSMSPAPPSISAKLRSPLPPRPPPSKVRKLTVESGATTAVVGSGADSGSSRAGADSGVKVIVRMRPPNKNEEEGEMIVQKVSNDTLSIGAHNFTFDSIADTEATQVDLFQLVGAPLVENCLSGFNSSVFAYGQTGSGKTYTIWGPSNALLEENIWSDQQGLTPRVFQRLFERINEEQIKHSDKQLVYRCRCSFLEIYNEQITDLLDPTQKTLQIREDVKTGVYVENLLEEYVSTMKDVTQLLKKGLSNRRTGATSINAESSRSHSVFTCVVESRCKSLEDGLSYFKTSRINLVDLAGSERQKLTGAAGDRLKEAGNINRSLSQLGNLINILAEVSQTGKQRHVPYRDSKLTFLLQESLGGNAKLAMICAISPVQSCKSETFSTLRFAQRAKAIKNKAVINEEMQDDVNVLREVIRQLKEELLRMKENGNQTDQNANFSSRWNARRSLNLLKFSLNRPMTLPHLDDDGDEEMEIVEEAEEIIQQALQLGASEEGIRAEGQPKTDGSACTERQVSLDTDVNMEEEGEQLDKDIIMVAERCEQENFLKADEVSSLKTIGNDSCGQPTEEEVPKEALEYSKHITADGSVEDIPATPAFLENRTPDLSLVPCDVSPILKSPTPSVSPKALSSSRKSLRSSSSLTETQRSICDTKLELETPCVLSSKPSNSICLSSMSTQKSKLSSRPTEYLAASLHRGLEIIGSHRKSAALRRSSFRFSCKLSDTNAIFPVSKVDVGVQTILEDSQVLEDESRPFLCSKCKAINYVDGLNETSENTNSQLVTVDGSESGFKNQVPKAVEKVLAGAIRREMALEEICAQQNTEIMHLNRLVQQYKHERECNSIISQTREDKIVRLESLMDGVLPTEEFMDEELLSLIHEHKLLKEKYENHPEVLRVNIELKRAQDELERYRSFFDMGERDVLLEEMHDLRSQLQSYIDSSLKSSKKRNPPLLQLTYTAEPSVATSSTTVPESVEEIVEHRLEQERTKWTESESKWISLVEELRLELEASRTLSQKKTQDLNMEQKCTEELKEAMQLAMAGHARLLEQYAELEEKHIQLLARHRKFQDGIEDVKKAAAKAGVRGAESKFINALAAEISALKVEREKERRYFRDEIKGLQAQLRDTAEAVQAAGELLVRLKEAEEAIAAAEQRGIESEQETNNAYKQIEKLMKSHEKEISALKEQLADSRLPREESTPVFDDIKMTTCNEGESQSTDDQRWKEEFQPFYHAEEEELSKLGEPSSWFSGYDRCNI